MAGVHPKGVRLVLAQGSLSLFLLYVRGISKADGSSIRVKKEGSHVIMSCVYLQDFHGNRMYQPFSINLSFHSLSLANFSLIIRKCCCWQSSLAKCSFGANVCLTKSKSMNPNAVFFTWHKTTHKEIQGQVRLKLISKSGWRDTIKFYLPIQRNCLACDFISEVSIGPYLLIWEKR